MQCRDPEPSRFAHNLQNRKWSLSCFSGSASLWRPFRLIEDLRVIRVVTSGFGVLVAPAHVIPGQEENAVVAELVPAVLLVVTQYQR